MHFYVVQFHNIIWLSSDIDFAVNMSLSDPSPSPRTASKERKDRTLAEKGEILDALEKDGTRPVDVCRQFNVSKSFQKKIRYIRVWQIFVLYIRVNLLNK